MAFRSSELTIWNESKQGMINQSLMLSKVCFVAKTKIDDMVWNLCTNEFVCKAMTKKHTKFEAQCIYKPS